MKYDDLDGYIEDLFSSNQDTDMSEFDARLANVENAILDAYESAMRWHSDQLDPSSPPDTSDPNEYYDADGIYHQNYPYWGDCGPNG